MNTRKLIGGALALMLTTTAAAAQDLKPFTFSLNITGNGSQGGFIYAKQLGLYEEQGLDVTIVEGKGSATTAQIVATGQVDLAMADGPTIMQLRSKGAPITVIAPVLQTNAYGIISLADAPVTTAKDMEGKQIGMDPGTAMAALMNGIIAYEQVDLSKVEVVNLSTAAMVSSLLEGRVDAILAGADVQGIQVNDQKPAHIVMFNEVGIDAVGLSVFGRDDLLAEKEEEVRAFLSAGFAGWQAALENPEAAAEAIATAYPAVNREAVLKQLEVDLQLLCIPGSATMGRVSEEIWAANHEILTNYLDVPADEPKESYYSEAYLPDDLPACN